MNKEVRAHRGKSRIEGTKLFIVTTQKEEIRERLDSLVRQGRVMESEKEMILAKYDVIGSIFDNIIYRSKVI